MRRWVGEAQLNVGGRGGVPFNAHAELSEWRRHVSRRGDKTGADPPERGESREIPGGKSASGETLHPSPRATSRRAFLPLE